MVHIWTCYTMPWYASRNIFRKAFFGHPRSKSFLLVKGSLRHKTTVYHWWAYLKIYFCFVIVMLIQTGLHKTLVLRAISNWCLNRFAVIRISFWSVLCHLLFTVLLWALMCWPMIRSCLFCLSQWDWCVSNCLSNDRPNHADLLSRCDFSWFINFISCFWLNTRRMSKPTVYHACSYLLCSYVRHCRKTGFADLQPAVIRITFYNYFID